MGEREIRTNRHSSLSKFPFYQLDSIMKRIVLALLAGNFNRDEDSSLTRGSDDLIARILYRGQEEATEGSAQRFLSVRSLLRAKGDTARTILGRITSAAKKW